jgi:hypothetical protein
MTDIFDKILISLLVLMLPLSIFITSRSKNQLEGGGSTQLEEANMQRIDMAIDQIKTTVASDKKSHKPDISIESVTFASTSGELKVRGTAPTANLNIMVSAIISPPETDSKSASGSAEVVGITDEAVLGEAVEVVAVKPNSEGKFAFIKRLNQAKVGIIELRLKQLDSEVVIQYNLQEKDHTYTVFPQD